MNQLTPDVRELCRLTCNMHVDLLDYLNITVEVDIDDSEKLKEFKALVLQFFVCAGTGLH